MPTLLWVPKLSSDAFGTELSTGHVITNLCIQYSWNDYLHFKSILCGTFENRKVFHIYFFTYH